MKFFHHYGKIANPLINLLNKNAFHWTTEVEQAFINLKRAMCTTPVLVVPDFNKIFVVESDALGTGIGIVLTQEGLPIAFTSQALSGHNLYRPTYQK